ncbi:hypothetical protein D3227_27265 [Mesorhizobium waimense]|uniref:Uncharacterized protein n=1 Tax=Mesorhizobium waimense TaxID=1300307 RepID=A0A3A5KHT4_9HYPH|nr:hypothetical protein [Mesorhizobium waimense]RJT32103.1 hypothetical protein D3227_27265 [Mesorhizobium waimense]
MIPLDDIAQIAVIPKNAHVELRIGLGIHERSGALMLNFSIGPVGGGPATKSLGIKASLIPDVQAALTQAYEIASGK